MSSCTVIAAHEIPDRPPLQLTVGEIVDVGHRNSEWPEFVLVSAAGGRGWVPARHLSADQGKAMVKLAYDTAELPTRTGEQLHVLVRDEVSGWTWCRNASGREGWVPDRTLEFS